MAKSFGSGTLKARPPVLLYNSFCKVIATDCIVLVSLFFSFSFKTCFFSFRHCNLKSIANGENALKRMGSMLKEWPTLFLFNLKRVFFLELEFDISHYFSFLHPWDIGLGKYSVIWQRLWLGFSPYRTVIVNWGTSLWNSKLN